MPIDFQTLPLHFAKTKGNDLGHTQVLTFVWPTMVLTRPRPVATISKFDLDFVNEERHFHQMKVDLAVHEPTGNLGQRVDVDVTILLRDFTGHTDDFYEGDVLVTMFVERV
jgi:hypothetical protein